MLDRSIPPAAKRTEALSLPSPKKYQIRKDFPLFVFSDPTQQVVVLTFIARKGRGDTLESKLAPYFMAKMLLEGTEHKKKKEIAALIDRYGASIHAATNKDTIQVTLSVLPTHFKALLPLFIEVLTKPSFPSTSLTLEKKITAQDIQLAEATPSKLAKRKLRGQVFGAHHPYGYMMREAELAQITTKTLHAYFEKDAWHKSYCVLSGAVSEELIEATKGGLVKLSKSPMTRESQITYTPTPSTGLLPIKKEGATQGSITMGMATITRTHPDYLPMYVLTMLLGGYFGSRLMENVREDKGYTYGIFCRLDTYLHGGYFYLSTEVKKGLEEKTCKEIFYEIDRLRAKPVGVKELDGLKKFLTGNLLTSFDNIFAVSTCFAKVHLYDLDLAHYEELYKTVENITPKVLQTMAKRYLDVEKLSQVIVQA